MMVEQPDLTREIHCLRIGTNSRDTLPETIAIESTLDIIVDGELIGTFACSPEHLEELTTGHLLAQGIIADIREIQSLRIHNSSEAQIGLFQDRRSERKENQEIRIRRDVLHGAKEQMLGSQRYQQITRGFHAAAIVEIDTGQFFACEDISRHSAMDKVIGLGAKQGMNLEKSMLIITGRLTTSIVSKAVKTGIALLASLTVATDAAIQIAKGNGLTLIGSLSETGLWLYHEGRTTIEATKPVSS